MRRHPEISTTSDFRELLRNPKVDAIAIATPVHTHFELAQAALKAGKHVLVEKPFAQTSDQVRRLVDEADRRGLTLMVDHTFLYTPAVQKIRELMLQDQLGELYYYDSIRSSLGLSSSKSVDGCSRQDLRNSNCTSWKSPPRVSGSICSSEIASSRSRSPKMP